MTKKNYEACLIMARSFINEYIIEHELKRKKHSSLFDLNDKLKGKVRQICNNHAELKVKAKNSAEFVLDKLQAYVKEMGETEVEANNLIFGLNFIFILIENNMFKGSEAMYFKRVSNELYNLAEAGASRIAVHNANVLIHKFDEEIKG